RAEKKTVIKQMKAIETLYKANEFKAGDEITKVDIGFHTRVPLENGIQAFVPTWKVSINDEREYFVNAIEGFVFSGDENKFLTDVISTNIGSINQLKDRKELKESILNQLEQRLEAINRGEQE